MNVLPLRVSSRSSHPKGFTPWQGYISKNQDVTVARPPSGDKDFKAGAASGHVKLKDGSEKTVPRPKSPRPSSYFGGDGGGSRCPGSRCQIDEGACERPDYCPSGIPPKFADLNAHRHGRHDDHQHGTERCRQDDRDYSAVPQLRHQPFLLQ
jgi:hypothetical protein